MKHNEFTTRTELKSLTRSIKCAETKCGRLRMLKVCLGASSMRLGVPFIAPRQLAVGGNLERLILRHWTVTVAVRCVISFLFWRIRPLQIRGSWCTGHCPVHTGQSGAPCRPLARLTHRVKIARPTVGAVDHWLTGQSGVPPDSPVYHRIVR
jgi:hypothetical protein